MAVAASAPPPCGAGTGRLMEHRNHPPPSLLRQLSGVFELPFQEPQRPAQMVRRGVLFRRKAALEAMRIEGFPGRKDGWQSSSEGGVHTC